ncbi:hypothetical protein ACFWXK_39315 [Streptomyces sp. NPDC059070]|uniref:hypothetical protein n=1 Tax=Streptomyces sp. NPDC059070 TaxID=3346713 RepID=UPI0036C42CED
MTEKDPAAESIGLTMIDAAQVEGADKATLSLEERDGVTVLAITGGTTFPATLPVVDESGEILTVLRVVPDTQVTKPASNRYQAVASKPQLSAYITDWCQYDARLPEPPL